MSDIYDEVVREWIARQIRARGHHQYTRDRVRNVRLGIEQGFHGSDVTPADDPEAAIKCEIQTDARGAYWVDKDGWMEHSEFVPSVAGLVRECAEILAELQTA